jgi:hypothetical protein
MTLREKLEWFWAVGELPGTIFDDLNDRKPEVRGQPRRQNGKRMRLGSRKGHNETSIHHSSCIESRQRS